MFNKIYLALIISLISQNLYAEGIGSKIKRTIVDEIFSEFFNSLAKIPGLDKLALKVENNKYQIITSDWVKQKAKLSLTSFHSGDKAMLVPINSKYGYSITATSEIPYGKYQLIITPKDSGLQKINRNLIVNKKDYQVEYIFWNKKQKMFPLDIETAPIDARVRVLNIMPKYYDGMELKRGKYKIEVSAKGHKRQVRYVVLDHSQQKFSFILNRGA